MPNKFHRQNFNTGGGTELVRNLLRPTPKKDIKTPAQKSRKKTFESPMKRQRKLDTLKSEAAKTGGKVMSMDEMQKLKGESDKSYESRMKKVFEAKKGGRAKLRMGTNPFSKKSNIQKIAEVFGPKKTKVKKDKKIKKRMMANKGGRASYRDGTENELQKKVDRDALIFGAKKAIKNARQKEAIKSGDMEKIRKVFDTKANALAFATANQIMNNPDRFKPVEGNITKMFKADDKAKVDKRVMDYMKSQEPGGRFSEKDIERAKKALGLKKGGLAKKKKKFPDISGDGKVTMKDVLMARGVIPKNKNKNKNKKRFI